MGEKRFLDNSILLVSLEDSDRKEPSTNICHLPTEKKVKDTLPLTARHVSTIKPTQSVL